MPAEFQQDNFMKERFGFRIIHLPEWIIWQQSLLKILSIDPHYEIHILGPCHK